MEKIYLPQANSLTILLDLLHIVTKTLFDKHRSINTLITLLKCDRMLKQQKRSVPLSGYL